MTLFRYLRYLYFKYKPWPRSSREIRRWSRWSLPRKTREEIMRSGWDVRVAETGVLPDGEEYLFADPIHLIPKEMAAEWEKKHGPMDVRGTPHSTPNPLHRLTEEQDDQDPDRPVRLREDST